MRILEEVEDDIDPRAAEVNDCPENGVVDCPREETGDDAANPEPSDGQVVAVEVNESHCIRFRVQRLIVVSVESVGFEPTRF